jgi:hypothetical protein
MSILDNSRGIGSVVVLGLAAALTGCGGSDLDQYMRANTHPQHSPYVQWPTATGEVPLDHTIRVRGTFDAGMKRYYGSGRMGPLLREEEDDQDPIFILSDGATLKNVIIGDPAADGVWCEGSCTFENVWWEDVSKQAAKFIARTPDDVMTVNGGGASGAAHSVFNHSRGGTMVIKNFYAEWFGRLYRSCGNCSGQVPRKVVFENVIVVAGRSRTAEIAGLNSNYGDTAIFKGKNHLYDSWARLEVCRMYKGNSSGLESERLGPGPVPQLCEYDATTVEIHH